MNITKSKNSHEHISIDRSDPKQGGLKISLGLWSRFLRPLKWMLNGCSKDCLSGQLISESRAKINWYCRRTAITNPPSTATAKCLVIAMLAMTFFSIDI